MSDRTYFHVTTRPHAPRRAWHALDEVVGSVYAAYCGFKFADGGARPFETADRVPAAGHLCGSCSRSIAARTDIETPASADGGSDYGTVEPT